MQLSLPAVEQCTSRERPQLLFSTQETPDVECVLTDAPEQVHSGQEMKVSPHGMLLPNSNEGNQKTGSSIFIG